MKALFGIVSVLIVLGFAGTLAKRQLQASGAVAARSGQAASPAALSAPEQIRADTARALQQGVDRNQRADP